MAERWVGSLRAEVADHLLLVGRRHVGPVLADRVAHDNGHRRHGSLRLRPPGRRAGPPPWRPPTVTAIGRRELIGGVITEYFPA
jgi:hypothetical protein